jgi:hypothetical protein
MFDGNVENIWRWDFEGSVHFCEAVFWLRGVLTLPAKSRRGASTIEKMGPARGIKRKDPNSGVNEQY